MSARCVLVTTLTVALLASATTTVAGGTRRWASGYAGSLPADPSDLARTYFELPDVQVVLERLESGPMAGAEIRKALQNSGASLEDLLRLKLLRLDEDGYRIGFSYFTRDEMKKIHRLAERWVPRLVAAYREQQPAFDRIFESYDVPTVDRDHLAFVLLAGFALNWDALQQTRDEGYRKPILVNGDGWRYSFWASEVDPEYSTKGFVWGSSTAPTADDNIDPPIDFSFSTFGDPYSYPRMGPPALFYLSKDELTPQVREAIHRVGLVDESVWGFDFERVLGFSRGRSIGAMLFALREGPKTLDQLRAVAIPADRAKAKHLIDLLEIIGYVVSQDDGRVTLTTPVLAERDRSMVKAALALHREILGEWLRVAYPQIKRELSGITVVQQGLPFESVFTQIWHDFFGLATRQLAEAGLIADVYSPEVTHQGWFGVVWKHAVYKYVAG